MLFSCYYKKVAHFFEFFLLCVYIRVQTFKIKYHDNKNQHNFNKQKYLSNKRVVFTSSLYNGVYTFSVFDLTTSLINKMTKRLHFSKQQEPLALAA